MDLSEMLELFDKHDEEYLEFHKIENKRSNRPDLHAMLLLSELQSEDSDMIAAAEHDIFYLNINLEELAEVITEDQIIELKRCGIIIEEDSLTFFT